MGGGGLINDRGNGTGFSVGFHEQPLWGPSHQNEPAHVIVVREVQVVKISARIHSWKFLEEKQVTFLVPNFISLRKGEIGSE